MNEKNTWRYQQRKCNPNCRPTKETMSSQRLRTYHSFLRTNIHIYENAVIFGGDRRFLWKEKNCGLFW